MEQEKPSLQQLIEQAILTNSGADAASESRVLRMLADVGGALPVKEMLRRGATESVITMLLLDDETDKRRRPRMKLGVVGGEPCCWLTSQGWNAVGRPSKAECIPTSDSIEHATMPIRLASWLKSHGALLDSRGVEVSVAGPSAGKALSEEIVARAWAFLQKRVGDPGGSVGSLVGGQFCDALLIERWRGERAVEMYAGAWGLAPSLVTQPDLAETLVAVENELSLKSNVPLRNKVDRWESVIEQLGAVRGVVWIVGSRKVADRLRDLGVDDPRRRPGQLLVAANRLGFPGEDLGFTNVAWWPLSLVAEQSPES